MIGKTWNVHLTSFFIIFYDFLVLETGAPFPWSQFRGRLVVLRTQPALSLIGQARRSKIWTALTSGGKPGGKVAGEKLLGAVGTQQKMILLCQGLLNKVGKFRPEFSAAKPW